MKKLSLNSKKIALSLLVVGLAVGFSAFKNAGKRISATYYQTAPGHYKLLNNPEGDCEDLTTNRPCSIFFTTAPVGVTEFDYTDPSKPAGGQESAEKRLFVESEE